ncbi:hypothetical protein KIPB_007608 [Kipferlia bialata]|uniref:Uncharacterized protein n=1 Tax=Kipferlia bialata TaxID=797122 RepID=A0A9K3D0J3_9EUKA|nr:hypothetical protein KIPB_007608 [Kipferlia bialata]|eukprot:g7608.t1
MDPQALIPLVLEHFHSHGFPQVADVLHSMLQEVSFFDRPPTISQRLRTSSLETLLLHALAHGGADLLDMKVTDTFVTLTRHRHSVCPFVSLDDAVDVYTRETDGHPEYSPHFVFVTDSGTGSDSNALPKGALHISVPLSMKEADTLLNPLLTELSELGETEGALAKPHRPYVRARQYQPPLGKYLLRARQLSTHGLCDFRVISLSGSLNPVHNQHTKLTSLDPPHPPLTRDTEGMEDECTYSDPSTTQCVDAVALLVPSSESYVQYKLGVSMAIPHRVRCLLCMAATRCTLNTDTNCCNCECSDHVAEEAQDYMSPLLDANLTVVELFGSDYLERYPVHGPVVIAERPGHQEILDQYRDRPGVSIIGLTPDVSSTKIRQQISEGQNPDDTDTMVASLLLDSMWLRGGTWAVARNSE